MLRLACSTNALTGRSLDEALTAVAAAGYQGVEILCDTPHLFPPAWRPADSRRLRRHLDELGLAVSNCNANTAMGYYGQSQTIWEPLFEPSLANPEPEARRWRLAYSRRCLEIAGDLGAGSVSITSGRPVPGCPPERGLELLAAGLEELLPLAARLGIRLGIEYEPGLLIENALELAGLLAHFDSPWLGANLDVGHAVAAGEEPEEVVRRLAGRIVHLHLEDIRGRKHYHLVPGDGDIDFATLFTALAAVDYQGFGAVELYTFAHDPEPAIRRARVFLETIINGVPEPSLT